MQVGEFLLKMFLLWFFAIQTARGDVIPDTMSHAQGVDRVVAQSEDVMLTPAITELTPPPVTEEGETLIRRYISAGTMSNPHQHYCRHQNANRHFRQHTSQQC